MPQSLLWNGAKLPRYDGILFLGQLHHSTVAPESRTAAPHLRASARWNSLNALPVKAAAVTPRGSNLLRNVVLAAIRSSSAVNASCKLAGSRAGAKTAHQAVASKPA